MDCTNLTSVALEDVPCPMGCARDDEALFIAHDRFHNLPGDYAIVRCRGCDLVRTNPRPQPSSMGFYYPDNYGPYQSTAVTDAHTIVGSPSVLRRILRIFSRRLIAFNVENIPTKVPGQLFEIGCASGSYLARMKALGWKVAGLEFSASAADRARAAGLSVQTGAIEVASAPEVKPDLIVGWMVLEHMHDPVSALAKMNDWAKPNAWLALSTPNIASFDFKLFGPNSYALQLPNHLYHFSPRTITRLLERGGWSVTRIFHQRVLSNYIGSIGFWLEAIGAPTWLSRWVVNLSAHPGYYHLTLYPLAWLLSLFGQTGRMTVWAQRRAPELADAKFVS